jgi:hypothetical protein
MGLSCVIMKLQNYEAIMVLMVLAIVILFDTYVMLNSGRLGRKRTEKRPGDASSARTKTLRWQFCCQIIVFGQM